MGKKLVPSDFQKANQSIEIPEKYDWKKQCRADISKWGTYARTSGAGGTGIIDMDNISD